MSLDPKSSPGEIPTGTSIILFNGDRVAGTWVHRAAGVCGGRPGFETRDTPSGVLSNGDDLGFQTRKS